MSKETLAEQIAMRLRRDILRGKLPPGKSVKERDIAADMGVSRTPIREAIRILSQEGLVELRPSRSPIVAIANYTEVAEQTEVLIELEKLSAQLACKNATDAQIDHIAGIVRYMSDNFDDSDPLDMFEIDMTFHTAIAAASGNRALAETHGTFLRRLWRARYLSARQRRNRERVVGQHTQILEALRARKPQEARDAIDNHLWRLAEDIRSVLEAETATQENEGNTDETTAVRAQGT
ncbi:MAG: GntR family transcriptional regulator [Sulfitobacter sp.]|nr:GntR family transcriptional regulator [Sulfitobacter sp.]